jgi:glycosyltransferase involved in cell wall biosynthesis
MQSTLSQPLISIVLATYNPNVEFFVKQINSLKEQTYINWKCIVIDDCSSTEKFEEIKKIIAEDARFTLHQNKVNLGSYHTFEEGLKLLSKETELICFCDQDDIWLPNKLERLAHEFGNSQISCVHSDLSLIGPQDELLHKSCWKFENRNTQIYEAQLLILRNTITGCSMMFRKKTLELALPFPKQEIKNSFHHDLWIALISLQYGEIKPIDEPLVKYRQHGGNVVGAKNQDNVFLKLLNYLRSKGFSALLQESRFQWLLRKDIAKNYQERCNQQNKFQLFSSKTSLVELSFFLFISTFKRYCSVTVAIKILLGKIT